MGVRALLGFAWGSIASEASDPTVIQAWQEALETCASEICSANQVEEDDVAARHCDQIPVASEFGGAGRTTTFGRKVWCAAMLGTGITVDLYAGLGDTAALLADGLRRRPSSSSDRRLVTFELNLDRLLTVRSRLAQSEVAVHTLELRSQYHWQREMRKGDWKPVTAFLVPGSTSSYLRPVCQSVEDLGLILLDPDVEMGYKEFADDWRVLEAQRPRMVAIYNTNLPGGAGWVLNRLLMLGEYVEVAQGFNDGGAGEQDVFHQLRAWSLLLHVPGAVLPAWKPGERTSPSTLQQKQHKIVQPARPFDEDTVQMTGLEAKEWIQEQLEKGYEWGNTTFRAVRGGEVLRIHRGIGEIVPVEVQRPTDELLTPPTPQTNAHLCFAEADPLVAARELRTPCFLNCEGPDFDAQWDHFRKQVLLQAAGNFPLDPEMVAEATAISHHIVTNDEILIRGRSLFMARLRHEYTHDGHLEGFCLFGLTSAAFLRARQMLDMEPQKFEAHGKTIFAPIVGLNDMDTAYTLVSDSNSKGGVEFSFLENTGWAVPLEDVIINLETQKADLGQPFRRHRFPMSLSHRREPVSMPGRRELSHSDSLRLLFPKAAPVRLCGVGDHLTATFDAVLMVQRSLELVLGDLQMQRDFLGRFCPKHTGQGHQCRQRCELLGSGCGPQEDVADPVAEWLDGIIHPESLDELPWDLDERRHSLAEASARDSRLQLADLVVCSHPTLLCLFMAEVLPKPMFVHASSTLLYGLHCQNCDRDAWYTNLRYFGTSHLAQRYLQLARNLLLNNQNLVFMAEGRFLAEQVRHQVRMEVPWVPPLGLYTAAGSWQGGQPGSTRRAVVLRSRFFVSLRGELLRSLLREIVSINFPRYPLEVVFLGKDNQFDEQWLSLQQLASFDAAILWPNDLHQRTFHEAYRLAIPLLMPDSASLFRAQRMSNWGYASYGASTVGLDADGSSSPRHPFPPWWNSFNATPDVIGYWVQFADWEQLPHIQRFATLPGLIVQAVTMNLQQISKSMLEHHVQVAKAALDLVSEKLALLSRSDEPRVSEKSAREQDMRLERPRGHLVFPNGIHALGKEAHVQSGMHCQHVIVFGELVFQGKISRLMRAHVSRFLPCSLWRCDITHAAQLRKRVR
ncbi:unnamed protein product [Symbiodinium sp. CCMP2456]|nr:unnamed protein product [Symbiodinium sp. CCMP2456]